MIATLLAPAATDSDEHAAQLNAAALAAGTVIPVLLEVDAGMKRCGVAHYLSISGSHLAIFLGMFYLRWAVVFPLLCGAEIHP